MGKCFCHFGDFEVKDAAARRALERFKFVTRSEYADLEKLGQLETDVLYIITDDPTYNDLINMIQSLVDVTHNHDSGILSNAESIKENSSKLKGITNEQLNQAEDLAELTQKVNYLYSKSENNLLYLGEWDISGAAALKVPNLRNYSIIMVYFKTPIEDRDGYVVLEKNPNSHEFFTGYGSSFFYNSDNELCGGITRGSIEIELDESDQEYKITAAHCVFCASSENVGNGAMMGETTAAKIYRIRGIC